MVVSLRVLSAVGYRLSGLKKGTVVAVGVVAFAAGCTSAAEPSTTTSSGVECSAPPAEVLVAESEFDVELSPNPVEAGSEVTLSIDYDGPLEGLNGGVGASWECWSEDRWVATHILVRAIEDWEPSVIDPSDPSEEVIDIGLLIPNSYQVLIPEVPPGTYRIRDVLFGFEMSLAAYEIVEVVGS
jgi:hypothetical protein